MQKLALENCLELDINRKLVLGRLPKSYNSSEILTRHFAQSYNLDSSNKHLTRVVQTVSARKKIRINPKDFFKEPSCLMTMKC